MREGGRSGKTRLHLRGGFSLAKTCGKTKCRVFRVAGGCDSKSERPSKSEGKPGPRPDWNRDGKPRKESGATGSREPEADALRGRIMGTSRGKSAAEASGRALRMQNQTTEVPRQRPPAEKTCRPKSPAAGTGFRLTFTEELRCVLQVENKGVMRF